MSKREFKHPHFIEVQKGPIRVDEQYNGNFQRQPEMTMRDLEMNQMRQDKMTLTIHTPKV